MFINQKSSLVSSLTKVLSAAALLLLMAACSEDSPLKSLGSQTLSEKYNKAFWRNEQKHNTPLWKQAQDTCQNVLTPNCGVIGSLENDAFCQ